MQPKLFPPVESGLRESVSALGGRGQCECLAASWPGLSRCCLCGGRESRQDFLSAALAPGLITNRAVEVYPSIVDENYLHNTTRCNLYLALFPWWNTGRSGRAQKCRFGPNLWGVNPCRLGLLLPAVQGAGWNPKSCCSAMAVCGTLTSSKPCFLQALGCLLVLESFSPASQAAQSRFVLCMFGQESGLYGALLCLYSGEGRGKEMCQSVGGG